MKRILLFIFIVFLAKVTFAAQLHVVAAENFYGSIVKSIGGNTVEVQNILSNPNQDPHLFSSNPSVAKAITSANIIIYNGLGYDSWINHLIVRDINKQTVIVVADLIGAKVGDNPHIWYKPETAIALAKNLLSLFRKLNPQNAAVYQQNFDKFSQSYNAYIGRIATIKAKYNGIPITATEPIFDYLAQSLGFKMLGTDFQLSIMNEVSPSPQQIINFEKNILNHQVRLLVYNKQVNNPITKRMQDFAIQNNIPVVGVSETEPVNMDFLNWMNANLDAIVKALNTSKSIYGSYHI